MQGECATVSFKNLAPHKIPRNFIGISQTCMLHEATCRPDVIWSNMSHSSLHPVCLGARLLYERLVILHHFRDVSSHISSGTLHRV